MHIPPTNLKIGDAKSSVMLRWLCRRNRRPALPLIITRQGLSDTRRRLSVQLGPRRWHEKERGPDADGAFCPDAPIVGLDDTLADRQPQSGAGPRPTIGAPKTLEDMRQVLGRDTWAGIPNDDLSTALAPARAKRHATALGRELESISE